MAQTTMRDAPTSRQAQSQQIAGERELPDFVRNWFAVAEREYGVKAA